MVLSIQTSNNSIPIASQKKEESCDVQRIKLEPEQASKVPFPPGCSVVVFQESKLLCTGEVNAVYVSFSHDSGSCNNCYEISINDVKGSRVTLVARGDQLRYGLNCPVFILPPTASSFSSDEAIEGIIKGFELLPDDSSDTENNSKEPSTPFLYTVEVSAAVNDDQEKVFRQTGIISEHIRFRPVSKPPSYLQDDKTSVVSFDDISKESNSKCESKFFVPRIESDMPHRNGFFNRVERPCHMSPHFRQPTSNSLNSPKCFFPMTSPGQTPKAFTFPMASPRPSQPQPQPQPPTELNDQFSKCVPLSSPVPIHFQGNTELALAQRVPDFSFLSNFPSAKQKNLPEGKRQCVMCGQIRWTNATMANKAAGSDQGKHCNRGHTIVPNQNKGLCTVCDVIVWVVVESKMQIKWCKGCKNFRTWAAFGTKGSATKCTRCRDRQKEKYAKSKINNPQIKYKRKSLDLSTENASVQITKKVCMLNEK